jgi:hypothetical protein
MPNSVDVQLLEENRYAALVDGIVRYVGSLDEARACLRPEGGRAREAKPSATSCRAVYLAEPRASPPGKFDIDLGDRDNLSLATVDQLATFTGGQIGTHASPPQWLRASKAGWCQ